MKLIRRSGLLTSFIVLSMLVCFVAAPAPLAQAQEAGGEIMVLPERATKAPEVTLDILLTGFTPDESLTVWVTYPNQKVEGIDHVLANEGGIREFFWTMDESYQLGRYVFTVRSNETGYLAYDDFYLEPPEVMLTPGVNIIPVPPSIRQKGEIVFQGTGYQDEGVALWLTHPDGSVEELSWADANGDGEFNASIMITERDKTGQYFLTGQGVMSGFLGVATFFVEGGELPESSGTADVIVTPKVVRQLEVVTIYGSGFMPGEPVSLWLTESDGTVWHIPGVLADENGIIQKSGYITALVEEAGSPEGNATFTVYGRRSLKIGLVNALILAGSEFDTSYDVGEEDVKEDDEDVVIVVEDGDNGDDDDDDGDDDNGDD